MYHKVGASGLNILSGVVQTDLALGIVISSTHGSYMNKLTDSLFISSDLWRACGVDYQGSGCAAHVLTPM